MKNLGKLFIFITVLSGISFFYSCNRNEAMIPGNIEIKTTAADYANLIQSFSLQTLEEVTSSDDGLKSSTLAECLTVTIHENESGDFWHRSWTFDWGTENCECYSGTMKKGKIHISLTDWWKKEGSLREITFEDFYINNNKMEGYKTILNTGVNEAGNLTFVKNVSDAKLTYTDETSMTWSCEKYSEQIGGGETLFFADDVWSVTGIGSGINFDGNAFTLEITSALIYNTGCFFPVSGIIEIKTDGESLKTINYGDGECDNLATVTVEGTSETIKL